jgi:glyoxylase-like metal-dependent hydrolase (beta-lactamase superfamily II)
MANGKWQMAKETLQMAKGKWSMAKERRSVKAQRFAIYHLPFAIREAPMRLRFLALLTLILAGWYWHDLRAQQAGPIVSGAHRFERVADGIYYATSSGTMNIGANSPVLINDSEAMIVDSGITPAAARAMIADLKAVTPKPIGYVVDSHYHYDHAHGNQVYAPTIPVIGHQNTHARMLTNVLEQYTYLSSVEPIPARLESLRQRIAQEKDPQAKAALERQAASNQAYLEQVKETTVTPPNLTFDKKMTLYRGGREIQFHFLGRGHTDTDVVVFLPKERTVFTGDLMESIISYMGDSYPQEWIVTLDRLMELDFDTVLPGHGVVFKGKGKIQAFQKYLRDAIDQVAALRKQGLTAEQAAQKVDLTVHAKEFPQIRAAGMDVAAVRRMYQLAANPE